MSIPGKKYFVIGSLEKGIQVLELLAERDALSVSQVSAALGLNRSSSHRFLATLRELGYVDKDDEGKYRLTFKILEQAMKMADRFEIRRLARPFMERLAAVSGETVNLGFWDGRGIVHLDKIDSRNLLRIDSRIGSQAPAYCTALGKSILAHLPPAQLDDYLNQTFLAPVGPKTLTDPEAFRAALAEIRKRGMATDNEEMAPGLRCVAAPVFDYTGFPRYALSVSGPAVRMGAEEIRRIVDDVREAAKVLSRQLGQPGRTPGPNFQSGP